MLLTADVGNTNIKLGLFDGERLVHKLRVSTNPSMTSDEYAVELYTFFQIYNIISSAVTASIISSVVPKVTQPLREAIEIVTGVKSLLIGPGLKTGMELKIDHPETLGGDIVCGCVGAFKKYGGPLIMIFMGTATVIAHVDEQGGLTPLDERQQVFDDALEQVLLRSCPAHGEQVAKGAGAGGPPVI